MREMDLTTGRMMSILWLVTWRGFIAELVLFLVLATFAGAIKATTGLPTQPRLGGALIILGTLALSPGVAYVIVLMALRKKYRNFRIAILSSVATVADNFS